MPIKLILTGVLLGVSVIGNGVQLYNSHSQRQRVIDSTMRDIIPTTHRALEEYQAGQHETAAYDFGRVGGELMALKATLPPARVGNWLRSLSTFRITPIV